VSPPSVRKAAGLQRFCLVYERLIARPDRRYGAGIGSSCHRQGLALSKRLK
jgi:2'-deoxycytidine 5'-triphosphate deaminase (DCD)